MLKETESKEGQVWQSPEVKVLAADFYYEEGYKEKTVKDSNMPVSLVSFDSLVGQDANRRYNFFFLNEKEILTANANTFEVIHLETRKKRIFPGSESGGVGCVTVDLEKRYFAVGECGEWPNIYIYHYNKDSLITEGGSLRLHRVLRKGTEKAYSALNFNSSGDKVASVGSDPDYNLIIWNWRSETIILKAKAFSQEIFNVQFSDNFEGKLITSGIGHIKFWEMAKTFTGLKLQGELGKFGQIDLSDVSAFLEFPDGKVLCGTEYGTFLLWEGIFIKSHIMTDSETKCHNGLVDYMAWEETNLDIGEPESQAEGDNTTSNATKMTIVTGGHDGYLKWWSFAEFDNLTVDDNSLGFSKPLKEKLLLNPVTKSPVKIINLVKQKDFILVQDGNGYMLRLSSDLSNTESLYHFHSGPVIKLALLGDSLVTQGRDCSTYLIDTKTIHKDFTKKLTLASNLELEATSCDFAARENADDPFVTVIGYSIGLYRVFQYDVAKNKLDLVSQGKAHEAAITRVMFSPDKSYLCTATSSEIFVHVVQDFDKITPQCCFRRGEREEIVDLDWHFDSQRILVGLSSGSVEEIEIPKSFDSSKSFLIKEYTKRQFTVKLAEGQLNKDEEKKKKRNKDYKAAEEPEAAAILSCKYANLYSEGDFLVTAVKPFNDCLYLCNFEENEANPKLRPINFWLLPKTHTTKEFYIRNLSKSFVVLVNNRGAVQIRSKSCLDRYVEIFPNLLSASVLDIILSQDERKLCVSYRDGTTLLYNVNLEGIESYIKEGMVTESESQNTFNDDSPPMKRDYKVLPDENRESLVAFVSLEKEKTFEQEMDKVKQAEEKKNKSRSKIARLREDYQRVVAGNNELHEEIRLTADELIVDEEYIESVRQNNSANLLDIKHKYDWLKANVDFSIERITKFFLESVRTPKMFVWALESRDNVCTIRCPTLPPKFEEEVKKMEIQIYDLQKRIDFRSLKPKYEKYLNTQDMNKEKEEEHVRDLIETTGQRLIDYHEAEREKKNVHSGSTRAETNKNSIRDELDFTTADLNALKKIIEDKKGIKDKTRKYLEVRDKVKETNSKASRYPDGFSLKMNYDAFYNEEKMRTVLLHRKKIFDFLNRLYVDREQFNRAVFNLKEEKTDLISFLKEKKVVLQTLNKALGIDEESEKFEWLDHTQGEDEFPEKMFDVKPEALQTYLKAKLAKDKEATAIFQEAANEEDSTNLNHSNPLLSFVVKERRRNPLETNVESELRSINVIKSEHKKRKLIAECQSKIAEFDGKVQSLKSKRSETALKQKLGEYELLIKHEEYSIIRAFESDDAMLVRKLEELYGDFQENLRKLHDAHIDIEQKERSLKIERDNRKAKETEFFNLIANEKDNREQIIKCFYQKRKIDLNKDGGEAQLENEEELDLPRNITGTIKSEILTLRDSRVHFDDSIDKLTDGINIKRKEKQILVQTKVNLDRKLEEIRNKINSCERKKSRYMNLIEFSVPLKLDQFCYLPVKPESNEWKVNLHKLQMDISNGVLVSQTRMKELKDLLSDLKQRNDELETSNEEFNTRYDSKERERKDLDKQLRELETNFQNEQILKFGLVIDFHQLLKASESSVVDKLENEYKILKRQADFQLDEYKVRIDEMKKDLKVQLSENTGLLKQIKDGLERNQNLDKKLNEKNNEIDKKSEKKFVMFNIQEKKEKLKEILKLLEQQMDALKKEIDIFRRKGGHIYSTIASNLN